MELSLADSVFESVSALTTTGATIITQLDGLPHSILFYRQLMQWLGGMGIIVLAIAILPMLRIGGMQMFKAETPGPMKDQKLTPRITETAKTLWYLYLGLTIVCAIAYYMAGMSLFDAVGHAFSTLATGGMSTHDASIGYFNNSLIELICMIFMIIAGFNFASHFIAWRSASMKVYLNDTEVKLYFVMLIAATIITSIIVILNQTYPTLYESIRHSAFQVVAMVTNTGYATENISSLPWMLPLFLMMLGTVGACAGSTSGGIKLIRLILLYKLSMRELYRLIHPHGKFIIKLDGKTVNYRVLDSVSAFILQFMFLLVVFTLVLMTFGEDVTTSGTATLSALANLGPALGDAGSNYASLHDGSKWVLSLVMIFGRLEIFTIFLLFIPAYWES
jgi:trk system potassium uptake protein TrkH